jgi:hypothetical protein
MVTSRILTSKAFAAKFTMKSDIVTRGIVPR